MLIYGRVNDEDIGEKMGTMVVDDHHFFQE